MEHGKQDFEELDDLQVQHFADLLEGISYPIHPDDMDREGKLACGACKVVYVEMWQAKVKLIVDAIQPGQGTDADEIEITPELRKALLRKLDESEEFLSEE
jgi:CRISPR/Cas system-associated exonuclease Cas4 (RecB family)